VGEAKTSFLSRTYLPVVGATLLRVSETASGLNENMVIYSTGQDAR